MSVVEPIQRSLSYCAFTVSPSALLFFKLALAVLSPLRFHVNLESIYPLCPTKNTFKAARILIGTTLNLMHQSGKNQQPNNI